MNIQLPDQTLALIDAAYLGVLSMYGQGPRTLRSLLFTAAVYGGPTILHWLDMDQLAPLVDRVPKYASRVGVAYSVISAVSLLLAAVVALPILSALWKTSTVQGIVHQAEDAVQSGLQGQAPAGRTKASRTVDDIDDGVDEGPRTRHGYKLDQ